MKILSVIARRKIDQIVSKYRAPAFREATKRYVQDKDLPHPRGQENEISVVPFDLYYLHKPIFPG